MLCVLQNLLAAAEKALSRAEALVTSTLERHRAVLSAREDAKSDIIDLSGRLSSMYAKADSLGLPLPPLPGSTPLCVSLSHCVEFSCVMIRRSDKTCPNAFASPRQHGQPSVESAHK